MSWEDEGRRSWFKIQVGEEKEFSIFKIVQKPATAQIKALPNKDYYYEFDTDLGTLTVNNVGLFMTLVNMQVREGDRIKVKYLKKGSLGNPSKFEINIVEKNEVEPDKTPF